MSAGKLLKLINFCCFQLLLVLPCSAQNSQHLIVSKVMEDSSYIDSSQFYAIKTNDFNDSVTFTKIKLNYQRPRYKSILPLTIYNPHWAKTVVDDCNGNIKFISTNAFVYDANGNMIEVLDPINNSCGVQKYLCNNEQLPTNTNAVELSWNLSNQLVVNKPNNLNQYYIFYINQATSNSKFLNASNNFKRFYYAIMDYGKNNPNGKVITKDILISDKIAASGNLTVAKHANNIDYWILVAHNKDSLYAYLLDSNGLSPNPVMSRVLSLFKLSKSENSFSDYFFNFSYPYTGVFLVSNDGNKLFTCGLELENDSNPRVFQYDFNRKSGKCTGGKNIFKLPVNLNTNNNGLKEYYYTENMAISDNDSFLYTVVAGKRIITYKSLQMFELVSDLYQIDLKNLSYRKLKFPKPFNISMLSNSINGKIYISGYDKLKDTLWETQKNDILRKLYCINSPNKFNCKLDSIISPKSLINLVDELDFHSLDGKFSRGLVAPKNRAFMLPKKLNTCVDSTSFTFLGDTLAYKLVWKFGDGDSVVKNAPIQWSIPIKHKYKKSGKYYPQLHAYFRYCNTHKVVYDSLFVKRNAEQLNHAVLSKHGCSSDTVNWMFYVGNADSALYVENGKTIDKFPIDSMGRFTYRRIHTDTNKAKIHWVFRNKYNCDAYFDTVIKPTYWPAVQQNWQVIMGTQLVKNPKTISGCQPLELKFVDQSANRRNTKIWNLKWGGSRQLKCDTNYRIIDTSYVGIWGIVTTNVWGCTQNDTFTLVEFSKPKFKPEVSLIRNCKSQNQLYIIDNQFNLVDSLLVQWGDGTSGRFKQSSMVHHYKDTGKYAWLGIKKTPYGCLDSMNGRVQIQKDDKFQYRIKSNSLCNQNSSMALSITDSVFYWHAIDWKDGKMDTLKSGEIYHRYTSNGSYKPSLISLSKLNCLDTQLLGPIKINNPSQLRIYTTQDSFCRMNSLTIRMKNVLSTQLDMDSGIVLVREGISTLITARATDTIIKVNLLPGKHLLVFELKSRGTCSDSIAQYVYAIQEPKLSSKNIYVCENEPVNITVKWTAETGLASLKYMSTNWGTFGIQMNPKNPAILNAWKHSPMNSWVQLMAIDQNGCEGTDSVNVEIYPKPVAKFTFIEKLSGVSDQEYDLVDASIGATKWTWSFGVLGNSAEQNPTLTVPLNQAFGAQLKVDNDFGCVDTFSKWLHVTHKWEFSFPNAISINGDGLNDAFMCKEWAWVKEIHVRIYSRWGEKIFESTDPKFQWKPDLQDNYVYLITLTDLKQNKQYISGTIQVLK